LEQAKLFAKHLVIEHRLIHILDDEIPRRFRKICTQIEKVLRHFSSIPFGKLIESVEEDYPLILYGEAADS